MMPLVERDVNTQPDISRLNRHSAHSELPYRRMNDENSPLPRQARSKVRQPSRRLLAPTRASTAKNTSPRTPVHQSPQSHTSKLPRRTPAANADASALKVSAASAVSTSILTPSSHAKYTLCRSKRRHLHLPRTNRCPAKRLCHRAR